MSDKKAKRPAASAAKGVGVKPRKAAAKLGKEDIDRIRKISATTTELYAEIGKLEVAKIELYNKLQQLSATYNATIDEMFSKTGCDPSKRYDLNLETGDIVEL